MTVGGRNEVQVFRTDDFSLVATIPVGNLPHGIWPSGDGTRVYVGLENDDKMTAIDTLTNTVIATVPIGQAPQGVATCPMPCPKEPDRNLVTRRCQSPAPACPAQPQQAGCSLSGSPARRPTICLR